MRKIFSALLYVMIATISTAKAQALKVDYVTAFENVNHPQVSYWFMSANMLDEDTWKAKLDSMAAFSKYTLIFLTDRGVDFYNIKKMHPLFEKLVAHAHQKGLKIGLQIWKESDSTHIENTDRLIQEGELVLDENGAGNYSVSAKSARHMNELLKSELFKIYAFKKTAEGFYDASSLKDITSSAKTINDKATVQVEIAGGKTLAGYTAYIATQHYYQSCSNFSEQAISILLNTFKAYADIPFDGIGLDEYKGLRITRQKVLEEQHELFRERLYSLGMAKQLELLSGIDAPRLLFDMRYAPAGKPAIRIKAINQYMKVLRNNTLAVEAAMYDLGKKMYGSDAFIGLHNTFHNNLDKDEVWQTGVTWWTIKRDYGHSDENTSTPIQMGIGMSYPKNAMYNMYYDRSLDTIWTKALHDLCYGIRTHYHAANDGTVWGVSIETPTALQKINKVENAARLLNRFNPSFPKIKLLVIYGMQALYNWYPNYENRGMYDVNEGLGFEKKTNLLWNAGYLNAAIPTDLVENGTLTLDASGKPTLHGYKFDAIIFLNPQYTLPVTSKFIQEYVSKGGKLLLQGEASIDFNGNDMTNTWRPIAEKAVATSFSLENVAKLGVEKNSLVDGVENADGSFTFTNAASLESGLAATFSFKFLGNEYKGQYRGVAVIKVDNNGKLQKLAATAFSSLSKNGQQIITLNKEADVYMINKNGSKYITIADASATTKATWND